MRLAVAGLLFIAFSAISGMAQTPVILISIDTLRGDAVGARTPNILSYAVGGTRFTNAQTQIPLTLPAHTALLTSTYPFRNGVEENAGHVPQTLPTLATVLKPKGYKTAAFIGSIFLERQLGLDQGFDTYDSPFRFEAFSRLSGEMLAGNSATAYTARERRPGALTIRAANQWLTTHKNEPVFLFIHLFDMHKPWREATYQAQAEAVDRLMGSFARELKAQGIWDRALVILTSDHGEGLGDHGESDHGYFTYQSTLHVPLLIHWPGGATPRAVAGADQPVGLIDIAPTILDVLKIPQPSSFQGTSLAARGPHTVVAESVYARDAFGWSALRTLREGPWKYIQAPRPELYNLDRDPGELNNAIKANPGEAAKLKAQLEKFTSASAAPNGAKDPARNQELLQSLGYLAPGPTPTSKLPPADPKDRLPELLRYEDAVTMLQQKRVPAAIAVFRSILASDPGNLLARRDLAVALLAQKNFREAIANLDQVNRAAPGDYVTLYQAGIAHEAAGEPERALASFEAAARAAPAAEQARQSVERLKQRLHR